MKNLIIILLLIPFALNAQPESWQFKQDKQLHFVVGGVIAAPSLILLYNTTNDWEFAVNGSVWIPCFFAATKEGFDVLKLMATGQGMGFSYTDFCYTVAGAIIGTIITIQIIKIKRRRFRKKFNTQF